MAERPKSKTALLKTHAHSLIKQYVLLDVMGRTWKIYTAYTSAKTGDPCEVTEYIYTTPISTTVLGKKEGADFWDETWIPDSVFSITEND